MEERYLLDELNKMIREAFNNRKIPLFEGRPLREEAINNDDIVNLKIVLNTAKDFNDFLRQV